MSRIVPVMRLDEATGQTIHLIRAYAADVITVGTQQLTGPCLISPATLIAQWFSGELADLGEAQLELLWPLAPEVVLLGTRSPGQRAPAAVRSAFSQRGVALETMDLGAACRTYNVLAQEDRAVAAALFPGTLPLHP